MRVWIVAAQEPIPQLDEGARPFRCSMLAAALLNRRHEVVHWVGRFDHVSRSHRSLPGRSLVVNPTFTIQLINGPGYKRAVSIQRVLHNRATARDFTATAKNLAIPDVIFTCLPVVELAEAAVSYAGAREIPVVVDVRDRWPDLYLSVLPRVLRPLGRLILSGEFRRAGRTLGGATGITAVSKAYLDWGLDRAGRQRRTTDAVFPLGYPTTAKKPAPVVDPVPQIPNEDSVVTFIGSFGASYDLESVIAAARSLSDRKDIWFVLAGDGDSAPEIRRQALGLERVVFTGWIDQEALCTLLHRSAVGLVAYSANASQSLPNKPFEYWSGGVPIVSSLPGELAEIIQREGVGVQYEAGDKAGLARAIEHLLGEPETRSAMGKRARLLFESKYSDGVVYSNLVRHLESICSSLK